MRVAGIGCRRGVPTADVVSAVRLAATGLDGGLDALATTREKMTEEGVVAAAALLGLPLVCADDAALGEASRHAVTRSERVLALKGLPSIAETAALAAAGPHAKIVVPRVVAGAATCAIAAAEPAP
jgi:cobalt-precorrin 5A hydrolase